MVPSFRCSFLPDMPPSPTTEMARHRYFPELRCRHWPSPNDHRLGTPNTPAIRSTRAVDFVASLVRFRYSLPGCLPPCTDQTGILPQPPGTFTSRLSTDRSSSPLLDITTTATGTPLSVGVSPAGMAASFAARSHTTCDACACTGSSSASRSLTATASPPTGCAPPFSTPAFITARSGPDWRSSRSVRSIMSCRLPNPSARRKWPSTTGTTMKNWQHENLTHQLNKALDQGLSG